MKPAVVNSSVTSSFPKRKIFSPTRKLTPVLVTSTTRMRKNKGDCGGRLFVGQIQTGKRATLLRDNQTETDGANGGEIPSLGYSGAAFIADPPNHNEGSIAERRLK